MMAKNDDHYFCDNSAVELRDHRVVISNINPAESIVEFHLEPTDRAELTLSSEKLPEMIPPGEREPLTNIL